VDQATWRIAYDGQVSAGVHGLKLVVRRAGNCARYVVLQPCGHAETRAEIMLSSGIEPTVSAAMVAAERAAARTLFLLAERRRSVVQQDALG
jgi:hypothetical protein